MQRLNLKNARFGRLVLLEYKESDSRGQALWHARCDCGSHTVVAGRRAKSGHVTSCGCAHKEACAAALRRTATKHGLRHTPEWLAWKNMRDRCYNPKHASYHRYGGRGITVCDRWRHDVTAFVADVGLRPSPEHSLERIDNDGPYSPENCRWATRGEQASNRRTNRMLVWGGQSRTMSSLAREFGLSVQLLYTRLKSGWPLEDALRTKPDHGNRVTR